MITRRGFLAASAAAFAATACRDPVSVDADLERAARLSVTTALPSETKPEGWVKLALGNPHQRDGHAYVPSEHSHDRPAPLLIFLHGGGQDSRIWQSDQMKELADAMGAVVLAPDSRFATWDLLLTGEYGLDVRFIERAIAWTFAHCRIDPARIAIAGFSDGAAEALGIGLVNGDVFSAVAALSPGYADSRFRRGKPRIFVSHGDNDRILPFPTTRDRIVPSLIDAGYAVKWVPFQGGHTIPTAVGEQLFAWLADGWST